MTITNQLDANSGNQPRISRRLHFASRLCAILIIATAAGVLAGWMFKIEFLKRVVPNVTAMNPVTACMFMLAGLVLWNQQSRSKTNVRRAPIMNVLAAVIAAVGATKLVAIVSGWNVPIDRLLFTAQLATAGRNHGPNEMAPNTALNLLLAGSALLLLYRNSRRALRVAECLAAVCAFNALFAIIGYAYGSPTFYGVGSFNPMALHSAVLFVFLAVGLLLCRPDEGITAVLASDSAGGIVARRLLPWAVILPIVLGALALTGAREGWYDTEFAAVMHVTVLILLFVGLIWWMARKLFLLDLEHRELERIRHEQDERLRQMADHIEDVFWMTSLDGHQILYASKAYEEVWGRAVEELYAAPWQWVQGIHEDDRARVVDAFVSKAPSGGYAEEYRVVRPDGTIRWVKDRAYPVRDSSGQVYRIAGIAIDITERKESERALREAQTEAERANTAKSEFLSRMSHELRTPLNAILGFGQILELEQLGEEHQESVRHIVSAGHHLLDLINEVLDISRIEAGRMAVSLEPVSLSEVLANVVSLLAPLAAEHGVELSAPEHSELFVMADRQRLKQVVLNLLSNAIKYNRRGGEVRIATTVAPRAPGRVVRMSITDTGEGIASDKLNRLFTPFERLGAEKTPVDGTGLGLALSKRLVELMAGKIGIESVAGQGSTFWIELPETENPLGALEPGRAAAAFNGSSQRATVLYIEDNPSNLRLVERIIERRPELELISSTTGHGGIALAQSEQPSLILLDLHLPDIHGYEVLQRLRSNPSTAELPVVVVSADATPNQVKRLKEAGAQFYLTKPIEVARFLRIVDEVLTPSPLEEVK